MNCQMTVKQIYEVKNIDGNEFGLKPWLRSNLSLSPDFFQEKDFHGLSKLTRALNELYEGFEQECRVWESVAARSV
jgi:hypothetical protein